MKKIINNIEIEYEEEAKNFIDEVIEYLLSKTDEIHAFFNFIPKETIKIKIVKSIEELKKSTKTMFHKKLCQIML